MQSLDPNQAKNPACSQQNCPVKENGKCLEGLDPDKCSHFYWDDAISEDVTAESEDTFEQSDKFLLYSGQDLSSEELTLVTYKYKSNIIIIIGESDSGKTTLLSSIFDLFQIGNFPGFLFAGSLTPIGFEQKCHLSRESSQARVPLTDKTNTDVFKFLHLAVKQSTSSQTKPKHLLLSDIGGERFREATSSSSYMRDLSIMKVADHIVFLIDGNKLADKFNRTATLSNAQLFIRRALDVGNFNSETDITIVVSKCDMLDGDDTFDFSKLVVAQFQDKFANSLAGIHFLKIAARPINPSAQMPFGFGVDHLMSTWITARAKLAEASVRSQHSSTRAISKYRFTYE
jgi:hypothetical protein